MKVDDLILQLQDLVNDAKSMPFSGGKVLVNSDEVYDIIDQIQEAMPAEVRQAKHIVADRKQILAEANRESENIIRAAEERKKVMLNQNEIVREAQAKAREIIEDAKHKSAEIRDQKDPRKYRKFPEKTGLIQSSADALLFIFALKSKTLEK